MRASHYARRNSASALEACGETARFDADVLAGDDFLFEMDGCVSAAQRVTRNNFPLSVSK
jgi:hypothetical protein